MRPATHVLRDGTDADSLAITFRMKEERHEAPSLG